MEIEFNQDDYTNFVNRIQLELALDFWDAIEFQDGFLYYLEAFIVHLWKNGVPDRSILGSCERLIVELERDSRKIAEYDVALRKNDQRVDKLIEKTAHGVLHRVFSDVDQLLFRKMSRFRRESNPPPDLDHAKLSELKCLLLEYAAPARVERERLLAHFSREVALISGHLDPHKTADDDGKTATQPGYLGLIVCDKSKTIERLENPVTIDLSTKKNNWSVFWNLYQSEDHGMPRDTLESRFAGAPGSLDSSITHTRNELHRIGLSISNARSGSYKIIENNSQN